MEYRVQACAEPAGALSLPGFEHPFTRVVERTTELTPVYRMFPQLMHLVFEDLPTWVVAPFSDAIARRRKVMAAAEARIARIIAADEQTKLSHTSIFHVLVEDPKLPPEERAPKRVYDEAINVLGAGTITTGQNLATLTSYILSNPNVLDRLLQELDKISAENETMNWQVLENSTMITNIIREGLRINYGSMHRLSRIHPDTALQFENWTTPPGTPVGMSAVFTHNDIDMFPEPRTFNPERWEVNQATQDAMSKRLAHFGHGSRKCLGHNLAHAEMYLAIRHVFMRLGKKMELFDTLRERDVENVRDLFVPFPSKESRSVRVVARE